MVIAISKERLESETLPEKKRMEELQCTCVENAGKKSESTQRWHSDRFFNTPERIERGLVVKRKKEKGKNRQEGTTSKKPLEIPERLPLVTKRTNNNNLKNLECYNQRHVKESRRGLNL